MTTTQSAVGRRPARTRLGIRLPTPAQAQRSARFTARAASRLALVLLALAGAALAAGARELRLWHASTVEGMAQSRAQAQQEMTRVGAQIGEAVADVVPLTRELAARLAAGAVAGEGALEALLAEQLARYPELHGAGVAFAPYAFTGGRRLYAPYLMRDGEGRVRRFDVAEEYDYTRFEHDWYWTPRYEGAGWNDPYYEASTGEIVLEYGVPVHLPGTDPARALPDAVVFGNYSVSQLDATVRRMGFGRSGYGFLFTGRGHFLSHPRRDYLRELRVTPGRDTVYDTRTIFEVAASRGDTALYALGVTTVNGHERIVEYRDPVSGEAAWIAYGPVPGPGWTIAGVTLLADLRPGSDETRRRLLRIVLWTVLGLFALCAAWMAAQARPAGEAPERRRRRQRLRAITDPRVLWAAAGGVSLVAVAAIALIWHIAIRHPPSRYANEVRIADPTSLQRERTREDGLLRGRTEIPTGVYLASVDFRSGVTVHLRGSVWQRYSLREHRGIQRKIHFPEAQEVSIQEVARRVEGDAEYVEWSFSGSFRQEFDYEHFPIDRQEVWLRMTHADHRRGVVPVPDLDSYPILNAAALPGIARDLVLPGWRVNGSYFSYREQSYTTNFGDYGFGYEAEHPELYFNLVVQREFVQPFISTIIPLLVAVSMLFAMLLLSTRRREEAGLRGFSAMEVVLGATALFFVVVFQHIAMRNEIPSERIIYMEYFYFATYLGLLAVSLNAILFACTQRVRWLQVGDNLTPKLLFWPLFLNLALGVTLWVFY